MSDPDRVLVTRRMPTGSLDPLAAIDNHEHEPATNLRLHRHQRVVLTPHLGSGTPSTRLRMAALAGEEHPRRMDDRRNRPYRQRFRLSRPAGHVLATSVVPRFASG